jgi:hypothetical protein
VSSTYLVLCLSHDPVITASEHQRSEHAEQAIRDGIDGHHGCDLMIGRYSYPLVELGCPGNAQAQQRSCYLHAGTRWVDAEWLRLLAAAQQHPTGQPGQVAGSGNFRCWTPERLRRLRLELGTAHLYESTGDPR